jgi:hypothetical protein
MLAGSVKMPPSSHNTIKAKFVAVCAASASGIATPMRTPTAANAALPTHINPTSEVHCPQPKAMSVMASPMMPISAIAGRAYAIATAILATTAAALAGIGVVRR